MARPHHRKKHKTQLQQFKHSHDMGTEKAKTRASGVFAIVGALLGVAIGYFGSSGDWTWTVGAAVVATAAGYLVGERIDRGK